MNEQTDSQLLHAYVERRSEPAFAELVRRYTDLVFSAALRTVSDLHLAQDVTQSTFVALARQAGQIKDRPALCGWLHQTARNIAAQTIRTDVRRRAREHEAVAMNEPNSNRPQIAWEEIAPHLDAALDELGDLDREALMLRYFQNKPFHAIGFVLGVSDDAAQKRVTRAVERLREFFAERGLAIGAGALAVLLPANAVKAAPAGMAASISTAALTHTTISTSTIVAASAKTIAMTTLQKTLVTATVAVLAGAGLYEAREAAQLRQQMETLRQEHTSLSEQLVQLQREAGASRPVAARDDRERVNRDNAELLKLRGEVTALRQMAQEQAGAETTARTWEARIALLKQSFDQMPDKRIPEMQFLTDEDWAAATRNADLDTPDGVRQAMKRLRSLAKDNFFSAMRTAISKYAAAVNGAAVPKDPAQFAQAVNANLALLPADLSQLKPYFDQPVDDAMLQRYQFRRPTKLHDNLSDILVKEIAPPADAEYDTSHEMGLNSGGVGNVNLVADAVAAAVESFVRANNGRMPNDPSQLTPYLKRPLNVALVEKYMRNSASTAAR